MRNALGHVHDEAIEADAQGVARRPAPGRSTLTSRLPGRGPSAREIAREIAAIDRSAARESAGDAPMPIAAAPGGARAAVQREASRPPHPEDDPFAIHALAAEGVSGGGGPLPHLAAIQTAFGHHDVSGVRAHVGGGATAASEAIGARAYATGDDVAFAGAPDLRQAAHEAAHVVQQRGGVRLDGGVGRAGDPYEQHADAVADLVARGSSAESLLDTMAHRGSAGGPAVQRLTHEERLRARTEASTDLTLEQLAHRMAYLESVDQLNDQDRAALTAQGFDIDGIQAHAGASSGEGDLQFWTFPAARDATVRVTPVIAFRGTASMADLSEDAVAAGVGMAQFTMNQALIAGAIQQIGAGRGVVATGHSLGGALAQIAACFYPELVVRVVTFQSPGISAEVLARLRAREAAGEEGPTATHHRVDGCVVDDAGDGFVAGRVVVWGDGTNPVHAHTTFPLLSGARAPQPWMTTPDQNPVVAASGPGRDPSIGHVSAVGEADGRDGGGPARMTATLGTAEAARSHTTASGAIAGGMAAGPLGAIVGGVASDHVAADAQRRDAYARVWMHDILPHAEAVDRTMLDDTITRRCSDESIADLAPTMTANYRELFPELAAADVVLRSMVGGGGPSTSEAFVEAVAGHASLDARRRERIGRYWQLVEASDAASDHHAASAPRDPVSTARLHSDTSVDRARARERLAHPGAPERSRPSAEAAPEPRGGASATMSSGGHHRAPVSPDGGTTAAADVVHAAAGRGVAGPAGRLPHLDAIQTSFGHHEVGGVRAHVGGAAADAAAAIGARAYATGDDVAFAAAPDLRQAAHEAAHVVQQRGGVRLDGGVGRAGDPYEQNADAVADRVVRGESSEALLDGMAHRGAAGGPAVQRLVDERGADAVTTVVGLLANASVADHAAIAHALLAALHAAVGPAAPVEVRFDAGGESYDLLIPIADARLLCGETAMALEHPAPAAAPAPTRGRGHGASRSARTLRSLSRPRDLASLITALAGEPGEESAVELTLRVPIPETPLHVTGNFALEVGHGASGFAVACEPRLGLGVGSGGDNAELMAGSRIEVTGHDAEMAAQLVLVAMDHQLRAVAAGGIPPALVAVLVAGAVLAPEVTAVVVVGDLVGRMANWASTGSPSDPVLLWLADLIFGEGHIAAVGEAMSGNDSVETVDTVALDVEGGVGEDEHRRDVGIGLSTGDHWSMAANGGDVVEASFRSIDLEFEANFPPWHGTVAMHFPVTRGEHVPSGEIDIELALRAETHSVETFLEVDLIARLAQLTLQMLAPHRDEGGASVDAAAARVAGLERAAGTLVSGARSLIASRAVSAGAAAELGIQLEIALYLGAAPSTMAVKVTDGFEADLPAGDGAAYTHARSLGSVEF